MFITVFKLNTRKCVRIMSYRNSSYGELTVSLVIRIQESGRTVESFDPLKEYIL